MANDDKTERATPRRRDKAREQGRVARSRELAGALIGFAGVLV
ncbi:MAG: EscU/YscU/HrcU family type III secretion system export apparatus switch protein, partial [Candidatus Korobacteraceae bacterium]